MDLAKAVEAITAVGRLAFSPGEQAMIAGRNDAGLRKEDGGPFPQARRKIVSARHVTQLPLPNMPKPPDEPPSKMDLLLERPDSMAPQNAKRWTQSEGDFSILGGSSLIAHCEPHFHETYVIAYLREGQATINFRGRKRVWRRGEIFLCNPYELVSGGAEDGTLSYDVCYPCQSFMREALGRTGGGGTAIPRLTADLLQARDVAELATILADFSSTIRSELAEQRLIAFLRNRPLMRSDPINHSEVAWISRLHDEVERASDRHLGVAELARHLRCDRSHLMRVIRRATGLPPSSYIRQLRLARALDKIRNGARLADTATIFGFADQAHLTREFKRIYGTTPGKLARDILH